MNLPKVTHLMHLMKIDPFFPFPLLIPGTWPLALTYSPHLSPTILLYSHLMYAFFLLLLQIHYLILSFWVRFPGPAMMPHASVSVPAWSSCFSPSDFLFFFQCSAQEFPLWGLPDPSWAELIMLSSESSVQPHSSLDLFTIYVHLHGSCLETGSFLNQEPSSNYLLLSVSSTVPEI